jgi:CheY-like chemotaxis protein
MDPMNATSSREMDLSACPSRTVMVVNGPGAILELFESILEPGHYDVVVVESGDRAYSQIKLVQPDLVILCVRMDDAASLQVLSMLKLDPDTIRVPVITYAVEQDYPQRIDELVDLPENEFWRESVELAVQMN